MLFAAVVLSAAAWARGPEYDEAYSIFLTAGDARPVWPADIFHAGQVRTLYAGHVRFGRIAHDLRVGDVHPPLYFWALEVWRRVFGPSWFAARMLSVACSLLALAVVGWLAALAEIPVVAAMLATLLAYGFAYTGIVARGFALAQLLNVVGMACSFAAVRQRRQALSFAGGVAFGAASFANYLAVFTGLAALFWLLLGPARRRLLPLALFGLVLFLPLDAWFFLAQRGARVGQFAAFSWRHALALLAKDAGAAWFGGLPLYAGALAVPVALGLAGLACVCGGFVIRAWRPAFLLFALAAAATPVGLLALGVVFHNTPIEIRYLAFSTPFVALLCAGALPRAGLRVLLAVEACAVVGLAVAPATMQPQGAAARAAGALARTDTLVLLPFGNDGVGVPGPFIAAAPDDLRILVIGARAEGANTAEGSNTVIASGAKQSSFVPPREESWIAAPARNDGGGMSSALNVEPRVILVRIAADDASRAAVAGAEAYFESNPCWVTQSQRELVTLYLNRCPQQQP